jgi:hypothetical protein
MAMAMAMAMAIVGDFCCSCSSSSSSFFLLFPSSFFLLHTASGKAFVRLHTLSGFTLGRSSVRVHTWLWRFYPGWDKKPWTEEVHCCSIGNGCARLGFASLVKGISSPTVDREELEFEPF